MGRQRIDVRLGKKADLNVILALRPQKVIFATGALPITPGIEGIEKAISSWDYLNSSYDVPQKQNIIIIGGGIVACEVAGMFCEAENKVTIIEMLPDVAISMEGTNRAEMLEKLQKGGVEFIINGRAVEVKDKSVSYEKDGKVNTINADLVVKSLGQKPVGIDLYNQIKEAGIPSTIVGDARNPEKIISAVSQGFYAAINV